jgi:hypothetical protein
MTFKTITILKQKQQHDKQRPQQQHWQHDKTAAQRPPWQHDKRWYKYYHNNTTNGGTMATIATRQTVAQLPP